MYIQINCHSSLILNKIIYLKIRSFNLSNFSLQKYQYMHRCIKILNSVRKNLKIIFCQTFKTKLIQNCVKNV